LKVIPDLSTAFNESFFKYPLDYTKHLYILDMSEYGWICPEIIFNHLFT